MVKETSKYIFSYTKDWELVEQTSTWSEEDETKLKAACAFIRNTNLKGNDKIIDSTIIFLKSLKDHVQFYNTWKPNKTQIDALNYVINLMASSENQKKNDYYYNVFNDFREQLKKLMDG